MKLFTLLAATALMFACGTKKNASESSPKKSKKGATTMEAIKVTASTGQLAKESDPIMSIDTAFVEGNTLFLDVTYGGGCKEHTFQAIGSLAIAKSYPPIRTLQLVHQSNGDMCKSIVKKRLEINIEEVAYQQEAGSEIYLALEGWKERIYYKYQAKK